MKVNRVYDILVKGDTVFSKCFDMDEYGRKSDHPEWSPVKKGISVNSLKDACIAWGFEECKWPPNEVTCRFIQEQEN